MFQRRPDRTVPRSRSLVLGGALAALAVVGGGTVAAVNSPAEVGAEGIQLTQNAAAQGAAQEMPLGTEVNLDLEPVVAQAAGGTIPDGTTVTVTGLPDGLTQDGWVISGTPTRAGEYDVLVTVSNADVSRSQRVTITVTEGAEGATDPTVTSAPSETTDPSAGTGPATQVEPTLSAVPGERARGAAEEPGSGEGIGGEGGGDGTGVDNDNDNDNDDDGNNDGTGGNTGTGGDGEGGTGGDGAETTPDLCSVLGGGQADGSSLAQLLPTMGDEDSASTGLVMVLVNAVVGLLPSVLGEDGPFGDLGSAGEMLCTLAPGLLGGQGGATAADGGAAATTGAPADAQLQGAAAALPIAPTALLGLLTTGAGSLGE
ncbi:hypothetical protein K3888_00955 [Dietzia aurantiaca]|uniref:putative Ig domain-containing protein n=1 Tax=Dietzia aurantiaca TaxID=983873 RepID=UPI001E29991B|nr:putative Ig domain-containing protein [Dietzia aurantiaca]MCD2261262.1 hypothetical protein [Dietzia aurantiaca]